MNQSVVVRYAATTGFTSNFLMNLSALVLPGVSSYCIHPPYCFGGAGSAPNQFESYQRRVNPYNSQAPIVLVMQGFRLLA